MTRLTYISIALLAAGSAYAGEAQAQPCSPAAFATDTVVLAGVSGSLEYCLAGGRDLRDFTIAVDGAPVTPQASAECGTFPDPGATYYYDLSELPDAGRGGDVYLYEWEANGELFGAQTFAGAGELAAYLLRVNPPPRWRHDVGAGRITSDVTSGDYSSLLLRWETTGVDYELPLLPAAAPGVVITLPEAGRSYRVAVTARDGNCAETQTLVRPGGGDGDAGPTLSTQRYDVAENSETGELCVPTDEVSDAVSSQLCAAPADGTIRVLGVGCFSYRPNDDFVGADEACLVTCDGDGVCDTTLLAFAVTAATDDGTCRLPFDEPLLGQGVACGDGLVEVFLPASPRELTGFTLEIAGETYDGPRVERVDGRDGLPATVVSIAEIAQVSRTATVSSGPNCSHAFQIAARCVTTLRDTLRLAVDAPREYCLSSEELFQRLGAPLLTDPATPADAISVVPGDGGCVTANATASGTRDVVLVACTRIGICDTTFLHVTAAAGGVDGSGQVGVPGDGPTAMRDYFVADLEGEVGGNLLTNDVVARGDVSVRLVSTFAYGTASVSSTGEFAYVSDGSVCGLEDEVIYEVCDARGCDSAALAVRLPCDTLTVFPGFSPNGDGVNDVFLVEGLDDYPGSRTLVFNRWGNRVMEAVDYASDWRGTFDGADLPDGVYFYILELPGRPDPVAGYVALYR